MTKGTPKTAPWGHFWKGRAEYHQRAVPGQLVHGISVGLIFYNTDFVEERLTLNL